MQVILKPWAKINIYLKVLGKRSDGYHEIRTLIHPIALFDELTINRTDGFAVNCRLEDLPIGQKIPDEKDNLVTKTAVLFFDKIGKSPSVRIDLVKRIPIGGGLGGGSSDAANTLLGLNKLFGTPLNRDELYKICLELGMDAPFFLEPRPALCSGRGEVIEKRYEGIKFYCVLVNSGKFLSTKSVYGMLNLTLTKNETIDSISRFKKIPGVYIINRYIYNELQNPAIALCPEIKDIIELLNSAGAISSFVCGSGSTVCGLLKNKKEAEEVMKKAKKGGSRDWWIRCVSSLSR